ncbi:uncharacterized protein LOC129732525 [Wyeomyia smithii]|uniref:uncharacterized protein LOC129732525 n=1 Tax=Wyeomyia smithii TaxID=174621 RepID=UPI002467C75C|nr:uncharacterized protein LOC129732525 [Wyeomyia smithii]
MEELGFCIGTEQIPFMNMIGQRELAERISPGQSLWKMVQDRLQMKSFQRQQLEDQSLKSYLRKKLNSVMIFDNRDKIAELNDRIKGSKHFQKLEKYADTVASNIARKELDSYKNVLKRYETKLTKLVAENEILDEKRSVLSVKLNEQASVVPETYELAMEDIANKLFLTKLGQTKMKTLQHTTGSSTHVNSQIKDLLSKLARDIEEILYQKTAVDDLVANVIEIDFEVEHVEKLLNLLYALSSEPTALLDCESSLSLLIESTKRCIPTVENEVGVLLEEIEQCRKNLTSSCKSKQHDNLLRKGGELFIELEAKAQEFIQLNASVLQLNQDLCEKENSITASLTSMDFVSLESISGMANIKDVIAKTDRSELKANFVGFVFEHLRFTDATVAETVLPHLKEFLTIAVFYEQNIAKRILDLLSPTQSYDILALDNASDDEPISSKMPPNVLPLADLLADSPIRTALRKLLRNYYYSYEDSDSIEAPLDITIIFLRDDIVFSEGGLISGGCTTAGRELLSTIENMVDLKLETINLKRMLQSARQTVLENQQRMRSIEAELMAIEVDSFERFDQLYQTTQNWSKLSSLLEQLACQQKSLIHLKTQASWWIKQLELMAAGQFSNQEHYKQKLTELKITQTASSHELHLLETKYDKHLIQFKWDLRSLEELLVQARTIRHLAILPEIGQQLVNFWNDFGRNLQEQLEKLESESADRKWTALAHELDQLEQSSCEPQRLLVAYNERLREMDRLYREVCSQMEKYQRPAGVPLRGKENLQRLYEYKRQLYDVNTQPGYKENELKWFQYKLKMLLEDERLVDNYRTTYLSNLTLPSIEKIYVIKLRMITEMMAGIPAFLRLPGKISLVLLCPQNSVQQSENKQINISDAIGLSICFVNKDQRKLEADSSGILASPNLLFFLCFLSSEGCKFLLLTDCLADLDQKSEHDLLQVLAVFSRNMQIFVTTTHKQVFYSNI